MRRRRSLPSPTPLLHTPQDFTPCELFQRIRGRTLWFLGDSQTWNFYYAAECFMREFAPSLRRTCVASSQARVVEVDGCLCPGRTRAVCLRLALHCE
mgnify:CR=1 FL=1